MNAMTCDVVAKSVAEDDDGYPVLERLVADRVGSDGGPLFRTKATGLFDVFLGEIPAPRRQHYTCNCCRRFVDKFGAVVRVSEKGDASTLLWEEDGVPPFFSSAVAAVRKVVTREPIESVFLSGDAVWGVPKTGIWTHLCGTPKTVFKHPLKTDTQAAAEKVEDYGVLWRGLTDYPKSVVEQAVRALESDALTRSEKAVGIARWLLELHERIDGVAKAKRNNLVWLAVATAPPGFAHFRNEMVGTLLGDVAAGLPFEEVKRRWAAKMHPLQYQRPATVSDANLEQAEKIVAQLGSAGSLRRRFAKLADVKAIWTPKPPTESDRGSSVFGHLKSRQDDNVTVNISRQTITWEKFARTVLPSADSLQVLMPYSRAGFFGLVTAVDPAAPPILQWDTEPRNPVSVYHYNGGSLASDWGLRAGDWTTVTAVFERPAHWYRPEKFSHHERAPMLALAGAKDLRYRQGGSFFPETLRSEYHGIRKAMEAYAGRAVIEGKDEGDANGITGIGAVVRVGTKLGTAEYLIDRMD